MQNFISIIGKIRLTRWVLPFIIFCALSDICAAMPDGNMDARNITVTKQDNGKEIRVKCGDLIQIKLQQMGGAGYQWYVDNLDTEHLKLLSEETEAASESKIGAPVQVIWRLKAMKKGSAEIRMDHYRVWEGKEKAIEHFLLKLIVE